MKNLHILLLSFFLSLNSYSQTDALLRFEQGKIDTHTEVLIPLSNRKFLFEKYTYFKYVYWLRSTDTLSKESDSIYRGKTLTINVNEGFVVKSPCDSLINLMRNSTLSNLTDHQLMDSAKLYIGYDNTEFKLSFANGPSEEEEYSLCHEEFQTLNSKWFESQLELVKLILA